MYNEGLGFDKINLDNRYHHSCVCVSCSEFDLVCYFLLLKRTFDIGHIGKLKTNCICSIRKDVNRKTSTTSYDWNAKQYYGNR